MAIDRERVKALFQSAIERDDPASRRAYLDDAIGDDAGTETVRGPVSFLLDDIYGCADDPAFLDIAHDFIPDVLSPRVVQKVMAVRSQTVSQADHASRRLQGFPRSSPAWIA
jgi:hypothetical protein